MPFSDLTLTLTWAKYERISLVSFAWSLGVHMESFERKMLRLRSLRSATWKHPILTFDLTLTWHVTSILSFRKWFGSVSSRSFECLLVRLSTSIRFWDSRGGGSDPTPPPRLWWVQKQPRRWRVKFISMSAVANVHYLTCQEKWIKSTTNIKFPTQNDGGLLHIMDLVKTGKIWKKIHCNVWWLPTWHIFLTSFAVYLYLHLYQCYRY